MLGAVCALLVWWGLGQLDASETSSGSVRPDLEIPVLPDSDLERYPSAPQYGDPYDPVGADLDEPSWDREVSRVAPSFDDDGPLGGDLDDPLGGYEPYGPYGGLDTDPYGLPSPDRSDPYDPLDDRYDRLSEPDDPLDDRYDGLSEPDDPLDDSFGSYEPYGGYGTGIGGRSATDPLDRYDAPVDGFEAYLEEIDRGGDGLGASPSSTGRRAPSSSFEDGRALRGLLAEAAPHLPAGPLSLMDDDAWGLGICTVLIDDDAYPNRCQGPHDGPRVSAWKPTAATCPSHSWVAADPGAWCLGYGDR